MWNLKNKSAEQDIRTYLNDHRYYGRTARFDELELHAIGKPGWLQVFRFTVEAKSVDDQWVQLFGILRDDERSKRCDVLLTESRDERDERLADWSDGLVVSRAGSQTASVSDAQVWKSAAVLLALIVLCLVFLSSLGT